ncbi:nitrate- and nitrite sensing domain-containing protein [Nocardiopsis sp. YSL2]|uniref:nitrate- and nitrite sensing domain-containing protein n=1 Tax=Nocardiopsis sp. YSL2 TaxID=2939492 RepID=UPI0026F41B57|nr:nitrate- and nitrite sensing domain-containing protein [Nocardiopsis sp. YSL2]
MRQPAGNRGIRAQLNRIVLIPSITFLVLFVVISAATLAQAVSLRAALSEGRAGIELAELLTLLQEERRVGVAYLAAPSGDRRDALAEAGRSTDLAVADLRSLADDLGDQDDPATAPLAEDFLDSLRAAEELRADNLTAPGDAEATLLAYTTAIHQGIRLYAGTARALDDGTASAEASATTDLMWAQESFSHADAVVASVLARNSLTRADQTEIAALTADARHRVETVHTSDAAPAAEVEPVGPAGEPDTGATEATAEVPTPVTLAAGEPWQDALAMAATLARHEAEVAVDPVTGELERGSAPPGGLAGWREAADAVNSDLSAITADRAASVVDATDSASTWMFSLALGGGITSLFAGTVAYGVAAHSVGRLTYRLARLRADTLGTARTDLPRIVRRLEAGESVDLDTEMKQLDHGDDEVGQVADAFNIAQRTAVGAAVKQADIRAGVSRVFLGIAHRNQSLVQRQIQLLDRIEREEDDPDLLESLFQLDHLATRGRRHAENLIILGGAQPGRRWRHPIPFVDILRGAISETEEYARVRLVSVPDLSLSGAVVADVIHMIAELVENATAYSPPHTEVTIVTETVPKGMAVEIEDRGLGMAEDALARANTTLSEAPEFDVMVPGTDAQLGLFVVARLAAKHDIQVQLRPSPYGGTRAAVLIPSALIAAQPGPGTERPRIAALARQELLEQRDSREASPGRRARDVLSPEDTPRGSRALLRPVPAPGGDGPAAERRTGPLLRQVPDLTTDTGAGPRPLGATEDTPAPADTPMTSRETPDHTLPGRVGARPDRPGLPRRRRQASLAPQLKHDAAWAPADPDPHERTAATERSPEDARRMMDAFSAGTRRGRAADAEETGREHSSDQVGVSTDDRRGESD